MGGVLMSVWITFEASHIMIRTNKRLAIVCENHE